MYILRKDDDEKTVVKTFGDEEEAFSWLEIYGGKYFIEKVAIDLDSDEPIGNTELYFCDEEIQGDDDYEEYGNYDGKEIYEE